MKFWNWGRKTESTDQVFERCMKETIKARASDIGLCYNSPFAVWCNLHVDPIHKDKDRTLATRGLDHEDAIVKEMSKELETKTELVSNNTESFKIGLKNMQAGVKQLTGICLFGGGICGIPDALVRVDKKSLLGNHSYIPYEIKSAKNINMSHIMQGAAYSYLLEFIQGTPPDFVIINGNGVETRYKYKECKPDVLRLTGEVGYLSTSVMPKPTYGYVPYPWKSYGNQMAIELGDISLVNGLGEVKTEMLTSMGINNLKNLTELKTLPSGITLKHVLRASALVNKKEIKLSNIQLPENPAYVDLEGIPGTKDDDFLIGTLYKGKYEYFLAENLDDQASMISDFINWCNNHDAAICHWSSYDNVHLKNIATKHGINIDNVIKRCVDLCNMVQNSYAFPIPTYGLKDLSKYCGYKYISDIDGMSAYSYYTAYCNGNQDALDMLLSYNKEDCLATEHVYKYVQALN